MWKLRLARPRRRITLWAYISYGYMLYESLPDTKPNKENGPWPLPGTLVKPDWRSEKSHFTWNCDGACVDHCFSIFSLFRQPLELIFSEIKEKWCTNTILDWFWFNLVARTAILNDWYTMSKIMKKWRSRIIHVLVEFFESGHETWTIQLGIT